MLNEMGERMGRVSPFDRGKRVNLSRPRIKLRKVFLTEKTRKQFLRDSDRAASGKVVAGSGALCVAGGPCRLSAERRTPLGKQRGLLFFGDAWWPRALGPRSRKGAPPPRSRFPFPSG